MARFTESVGHVTSAFQSISKRIRQIELKLKTPRTEKAVLEESGHDLGSGLGEKSIASQIREIQMLEKDHLMKRVTINDKQVRLARLDYDLTKQRLLTKTMDEAEVEQARMPLC